MALDSGALFHLRGPLSAQGAPLGSGIAVVFIPRKTFTLRRDAGDGGSGMGTSLLSGTFGLRGQVRDNPWGRAGHSGPLK